MHVTIITDASFDAGRAGFGMYIKLSEPVFDRMEHRFHGAIADVNSSTDSEAVAVARALSIVELLCTGKKVRTISVVTDSERTINLIKQTQAPNKTESKLAKLVFELRQKGIRVTPRHQRSHIAIDGCWHTHQHDWCDSAARSALKSVRELQAVC
tara:strand:- start:1282 stop:1746 length:465 start_codon:yes stop_codon:yes gene_type:complete